MLYLQNLSFEAMDSLFLSFPQSILHLPTIVVTDTNLHSTLWNPDRYLTHKAAADALVQSVTKWNHNLRSPKGVITFENQANPTAGTTIDLVWVNKQAEKAIVVCLVDENNVFNHHSDHKAMVTVISLKCDTAPASETDHSSGKNWHKVDQAKFLTELKALLPPAIPHSI